MLTDDEEETVEQNIHDLLNLSVYTLPTLRINTKATEEDVAEIFVRVNSGGTKLSEKNFIETLLAVYDTNVHDEINQFCADSRIPNNGTSYNHTLEAEPAHLIRMAVGIGFRRARLYYAYMLMRGKDLDTGLITQDEQEKNLNIFKTALAKVTDLNNWHNFMNLFIEAGYLEKMRATNTVVYSYILYLIEKYDYKVAPIKLQKIIKKWIFMATVTSLYSGSTESIAEKIFADLRNIKTADEFVDYLDDEIKRRFSDDYFNITLPQALESSAGNSPAWQSYIAAQNILGTRMLFSSSIQAAKMLPGASGNKKAIDKHHIFPKNYLASIGIEDDRVRNQITNFTYLDYNTNIDISDDAPAIYAQKYREMLGDEAYEKTCLENAIPVNFDSMDYSDFLQTRRKLMAGKIKEAYQKLSE